jgi:hypothetical protein
VVRLQVIVPEPPAAERVWLYATPTAPSGSDVVVIVTGGCCTVMVRSFVPLVPPLLARTVNVLAPVPVGVPLMAPVSCSDTPAGRLPLTRLHR